MTCQMRAYCSPLFFSKLYRQPQVQHSDLSAEMPSVSAYAPGCKILSDPGQTLLLPMPTAQTRSTLEPTHIGYDTRHAPPGSDMGPCGQFHHNELLSHIADLLRQRSWSRQAYRIAWSRHRLSSIQCSTVLAQPTPAYGSYYTEFRIIKPIS